MRKSSIFVLAAAALAAGAASPASAQVFTDPAVTTHHMSPVSLRLGGYLPTNRKIRKEVGQILPSIGVDYHLHQDSATTDSYISVDYLDRETSSGYRLRAIPITYGLRFKNDLTAKNAIYYGFGLGGYFTSIDVDDSLGGHESNNDLLAGGYLNVGIDINEASFLDLRYHITSTSGSVNPGGAQLSVGIRF
ncbi:MAG: hypothetical protein JWQ02_635 [Capsulimonas sp.]|jgi:hypothetical protein|nr:hypothetical protein [Capsulimonas sp.]